MLNSDNSTQTYFPLAVSLVFPKLYHHPSAEIPIEAVSMIKREKEKFLLLYKKPCLCLFVAVSMSREKVMNRKIPDFEYWLKEV